MPRELFEQLQMLLEPNSISGNDWRKLASRLGLCGMKIRYLQISSRAKREGCGVGKREWEKRHCASLRALLDLAEA